MNHANLDLVSGRASRLAPSIVVVLILLATAWIYAPALHGPFLLDDIGNLEPISRWFHGELTWQGAVFNNRSGPLGRPVSMLTFLIDVLRTGTLDSSTFKPTNLALHMIGGVLVMTLTYEVLGVVDPSIRYRRWISIAAMATWLWLPIQVSTVLYVVQRMAQLSALWTLSTLALYVHIRRILSQNPSRRHLAILWIAVPLLAILATFSKENGALALPLAAVAEWTLFRNVRRPPSVVAFFSVFVAFPLGATAIYLGLHPYFFSQGYTARDFSLGERLLSEPRIVWDYFMTSFVPTGANMGIYHDNYRISTSLWSPWSTTVSIVAWSIMMIWAVAWRKKTPLFTFGVIAYLLAHVLESGPIALELYFEHRNYLPIAFAIIALYGLGRHIVDTWHFTLAFRRTGTAAVVAIIFVYGLSSSNHALAWSSDAELHSLQYEYNPTSPRLLSVVAGRAILNKDLPLALFYIGQGERYGAPSEKGTASLWRLLAYCATDTAVPGSLYDELQERSRGRITNFAMEGWELLADRYSSGCPGLDVKRIIADGIAWIETSGQPDSAQPIWRTRYNLGRMLAASGEIGAAETLAWPAWLNSGKNNGIGVFLFQLNASLGHIDRCKEILKALELNAGGGDKTLNQLIAAFKRAVDDGSLTEHRQDPPPTVR